MTDPRQYDLRVAVVKHMITPEAAYLSACRSWLVSTLISSPWELHALFRPTGVLGFSSERPRLGKPHTGKVCCISDGTSKFEEEHDEVSLSLNSQAAVQQLAVETISNMANWSSVERPPASYLLLCVR